MESSAHAFRGVLFCLLAYSMAATGAPFWAILLVACCAALSFAIAGELRRVGA